ncbi:MAG TPA: nitrile hydratase subunit beta [Xanthobacteraceae bacterium]
MNGAHDMGGVHGFGPVEPESNEPVFHAAWERRAFAITVAMGATGEWNIDMSRFARENRSPPDYLSKSYYELWLAGLEQLLAECRLVTPEELAAGRALGSATPVKRVLAADDVDRVLSRGTAVARPPAAPARFKPGDRVRAKNMHPSVHTRLPRYVRGHLGTIEHVRGCHVFPDSNAAEKGENPQWLYSVRFDGTELWGPHSDPKLKVSVDAWESYLEAA